MSTTVLPLLRPLATPFSLNSTAATSGVSGTITKTMSAFCATSLPVAQTDAPASVSSRRHLADAC